MAYNKKKTASDFDPSKYVVKAELFHTFHDKEDGTRTRTSVRIRQYDTGQPKITFEGASERAFLKIPLDMLDEVEKACKLAREHMKGAAKTKAA